MLDVVARTEEPPLLGAEDAEEDVAREGVFSTWDPEGHLAWSGPGGIVVANADGSGRVALGYPASFIAWGPD